VKSEATLGRLIVSDGIEDYERIPYRMPLWQRLLLVLLVLLLMFLVLWSKGMLWGPLGPSKLVVRGCELLPADVVAARLAFSGQEPVPVLWMRARGAAGSDDRWLKRLHVGSDWGRVAVVDVTERRPVLVLKAGAARYWLCDDGFAVTREAEDELVVDVGRLESLPCVALADDPGPGQLDGADALLFTASALDQLMPGLFAKIERLRSGKLMIYEKGGFPVLLGEPEHLAEKLGALPKALRVCEDHKSQLRYLDASDHNLFYEKWKAAQQ
jgi:hypothetical protein